MPIHRTLIAGLVLLSSAVALHAQDSTAPTRRGRKYKAPPITSHIEVDVFKPNGKPVTNAAVVFHSIKDGDDEGNLEVKTNEDGKAIIDIIPTGSSVGVQVIADGLATYAQDYLVTEPSRQITIKMIPPRAQISTYQDNSGQPSTRQPGVQEPNHPSTDPVVQTPRPTNHTSDPNPLTPISPNATPGNSQNGTPGNPAGVPPQ